jgi:hypothetical protein
LEKASCEFHVAVGPKENRTNSRYLTVGLFQSSTGIPGLKNSIAAVTTGGATSEISRICHATLDARFEQAAPIEASVAAPGGKRSIELPLTGPLRLYYRMALFLNLNRSVCLGQLGDGAVAVNDHHEKDSDNRYGKKSLAP